MAVPVALWLAAGGLATAVATPAGLVTGAGILAGLVGTALLVLMLLLAARIPLVDRTIGHDRAIAVHSSLGQWTFGALVTHGLFIVTGYSLADGTGPVAEVASLLGIGDVAWAAVSLAALTAVAVTSIVTGSPIFTICGAAVTLTRGGVKSMGGPEETTRSTAEPPGAIVPPAGSWAITIPAGTSRLPSYTISPATKPASTSSVSASASAIPTTFGTSTAGSSTVIVT